jgi:hypothetical protein
VNKHFSYPDIDLWQDDAWKEKFSCIYPLAQWMETTSHSEVKPASKSLEELQKEHPDATYTTKTGSLTYPEVTQYWKEKGLAYYCREMGGVNWIVMKPNQVTKAQEREMATLLVFHDANYLDPEWAMKAMEDYKEYNEMAAREGILLVYVATEGTNCINMYVSILQEASAIFHVTLQKLYLDVSSVYQNGKNLNQVPGFALKDTKGQIVKDADAAVQKLGSLDLPVLSINGIWANSDSLRKSSADVPFLSSLAFDRERFIRSIAGRKMADSLRFEHQYSSVTPEMLQLFEDMGIRYEAHETEGEQWITAAPLCAYDKPAENIPVLLILQEARVANPHQVVMGITCFYEYLELVAQGDLMLVFFCLETPDDNDLLHEILNEAKLIYPIDPSRVYMTGHSHNGHYVMEYMRRHPMEIAAVAPLGNMPGQPAPEYSREAVFVTDEKIELMSKLDMPTVVISGFVEGACMFPLNQDTMHARPGSSSVLAIKPGPFEERAKSWQRRLQASNCPMKSLEEIAATKDCSDYVTRKLGIPSDKSDCLYLEGCECYIADIKNNDGKYHLRIVAMENMPHIPVPLMTTLSWNFLRRFARNQETGECIELY